MEQRSTLHRDEFLTTVTVSFLASETRRLVIQCASTIVSEQPEDQGIRLSDASVHYPCTKLHVRLISRCISSRSNYTSFLYAAAFPLDQTTRPSDTPVHYLQTKLHFHLLRRWS